jgi:opacity protein-like surface antigen
MYEEASILESRLMKQFLVAMLVGSATLSAGFFDCLCGPGFEGAYGGVAVGIQTLNADVTTSTNLITDVDAGILLSLNDRMCQNNVSVDLFVGYGLVLCDHFYVGGRVGVNLAQKRLQQHSNLEIIEEISVGFGGVRQVDLNYAEPTLDLKGGLIFCDNVMFFGLVGASYNQLTLTHGDFFPPEAELDISALSSTANVVGVRVGGGVEYLLGCRYGINLSYLYTFYPGTSGRQNVPIGGQSSFDRTIRASPSSQTASVGLNYYF